MTLFLLLLHYYIYSKAYQHFADDLNAVQRELRKTGDRINGLPFTADHQGRTSLAIAIGFRQNEPSHLSIVDYLLIQEAKINMHCGRGDSALDHALMESKLNAALKIIQEVTLRGITLR